jgi:Rieske Fe-S protein
MAEERRTVVRWLLGGGFAASVVSFLYPALRFMNPPAVAEASVNEVSAGKIQDYKINAGKIVKFGSRPALLVRTGDSDWRAYSAICTHLNCTVQFQESSHQIWCACHNGFYDLNGKVVSGPPPNPLEEFAVRVRGDEVILSRRA